VPFSLRLDPETEAMIRRLSAASGRSKSEVVREAVAHYAADRESSRPAGESAYDRLKPIIGIIRSGGANYSSQTHAKYRELLRRKHRARRPR
jgi:predicted DNA-binding protein